MLSPGTVIANEYRIERPLADGGMGAVFVAEQISTGAMRALKVIKAELLSDPKLRARFVQEARVTSRIASDHVVSVVGAGVDVETGVPWIAMELLEGRTLAELVRERGALSQDLALGILTQLTHAIDAAHAVGVVHRDLKPENIFLAESRRSGAPFFVKVLDFGIARVVREAAVTRTDSIGTPLWMSPEQAGSGEDIGAWTDVWAFGLIVFYLLTGHSYWLSARKESTALGLVKEVCMDPLPPASDRAKELGCEAELAPPFNAWFERCVARDPKARFATAGAALAALRVALGAPEDPGLAATSVPVHVPESRPATDDAHAKTELAPAQTPSGIVITKRSAESPSPSKKAERARTRKVVIAVIALAAVAGIALELRANKTKSDLALARAGLSSRDATVFNHSADLVHAVCIEGDGDACAALGARYAFPVIGGPKRDAAMAVSLLTNACDKGRGCALAGTLKTLAWPALPKEEDHYFGAACKTADVGGASGAFGSTSQLDCGLSLAHALQGPIGRALPHELEGRAASLDIGAACTKDADVCALAWLPKPSAIGPQTRELFERGCEAGSSLACNNLGTLHAQGLAGLEPNPKLARDQFERACDAGEPAACNNLGFIAAGFPANVRIGPRGALVYKIRCTGPIQVGCAGWGDRIHTVPAGTPINLADAVPSFERACGDGLLTACVNLGALAYIGHGMKRDRARAEKLFADACFRGDAGACGEQGSALVSIRMDHPRDVPAGFGFFERACKGGEKDSCTVVYSFMLNGLPERGKEAEAVLALKKLGDEGVYSHDLSQMYETGADGLPTDPAMARKIALAFCETDGRCSDAAYYLRRGIGGPPEEARASELLARACDRDDLSSCTELGDWYLEGHLIGKDPVRAFSLFKRACDGEEPDGCDKLSQAYATGVGAQKDPARALALARDACESGHAGGCASLGIMIADGVGTPRDVEAAVPYLSFACRRAALHSCAKLQALGKPLPELDL